MELSETLHKAFDGKQPTLQEFVTKIDEYDLAVKLGYESENKGSTEKLYGLICDFNRFIKQPLELKYLVPVKDGEVLNKAHIDEFITVATGEDFELHEEQNNHYRNAMKDYQKANELVIYEGFEFHYEELSKHYWNPDTGKDVHYHEYWKGLATWNSKQGKTMIISDMKNEPITLQWWVQCLKE